MITCHYCHKFQVSQTRHRISDNIIERFCPAIEKDVQSTEKACKHFDPAERFWCDVTNGWLQRTVCASRRVRGLYYCAGCKQQSTVKEVYAIEKARAMRNGFTRKQINETV